MTTGTRVLGGTKGGKDIVPFRPFDLRDLELNRDIMEAETVNIPGLTINRLENIGDVPSWSRYQLSALKDYLVSKNDKVCVLYGLRRTGKTTLIRQAIKWLVEDEGVSPNEILYITVSDVRQALLEDAIDVINSSDCKYIFLDEISFCTDFISSCAQLYDSLTIIERKKVVIAGTNLVSIFVANLSRLYDRTVKIAVHHLTFYEYCKFNGIVNFGLNEFIEYLKHGGLFEKNPDAFRYVQTSVIEHLISTIYDNDVRAIYNWYSTSKYTDYTDLAQNIILYAVGANIDPKTAATVYSFKRESGMLKLDPEICNTMREKLRLLKYTRLSVKQDELKAFMDFMRDCGLLLPLYNIYGEPPKGDVVKTYVTFPFIRFSYTMELAHMGAIAEPELKNEYLGMFMEACAVSEYHLAFPNDKIYFWREEVGQATAECDLVITNYLEPERGPHRAAFEIKASKKSNKGQRGFEKFAILHPEYEILPENCKVIGGEDVVDWVYELGRLAYISAGLEDSTLKGIVIPEKKVGAQRTSAFGDLNGWNIGN